MNNGVTANDMQALVDLSNGLSNSQMRLLLSTNNLTDAQKIALMVANGTERELAEQQLQTWGLINAQNNATASAVTLGSAMRGLAATMIANPIFLVTTAVTLGITAFNLYQSAVEKAEQKLNDLKTTLNETTTELESVQSEIDNINKQIDDLLAKDTLSITDENDLKRLREENEELRARKILLDAQREEDTKEVNKEVEHRYEKDFLSGANPYYGQYYNNIEYLNILTDRAKELLALNRNLTDEEKEEFDAIESYITEQSNALVELADSYEPITEEQKELKEGWEELIAKSSEVVGAYAGTIPDITDRLVEKFATGKETQEVDNVIKEWLNSLSDDNKKIMIGCELDNATLGELKAYLKEQTSDIETSGVADVEIKLAFDYGTLGEISQKLANVESAYKLASEARSAYNEQGYYSMEVIDSILSLEDEYINILVDENGQLQINSDSMNKLAGIKIETAKASIYQETCEELVRIKTLDTALAAQELALINGTLTESAYETAKALYEEVQAMGGTNAVLAGKVWDTASKKVKLLDNQLKSLNSGSYNVGKSALADSVAKASEDAEKATKEYIKSYMDFQQKSLERGMIDYNTYCKNVSGMLKDMFNQGKISAKDYHDYTKEMLETQKSLMDRVISAVTYRIDKQISAIKSEQDAIQDTIDKLREENDENERAISLEQAKYKLAQLQNQRTKKLYAGSGHGFIYTTDDQAIRDAQKEVQDLQFEEVIAGLEKEKDALGEDIKKLEDYKEQWESVTDKYQREQDKLLAAQILGQNWESDILSCRLSTLTTFTEQYIALQQAIVDAAWQSANEQNKAMASVGTGSTDGDGDVKVDYSQSGNGFTKKTSATESNSSLRDRQNKIYHNKMDKLILGYSKGTDNAKKGIREVSENGDEIIIDNYDNAILAKGHQLYNFEGGERVIRADETTKLLKNQGNLVPVEALFGNIDTSKFMQNMPNITPNINMPKMDYSHLSSRTNTQPNVNIGDIHLHEVQNVHDFGKALNKYLPSISVQFRGKTR